MNYVGKNIIITGGTGGISYALAKEFLLQGAQNVALLDVGDPNNLTSALQSEFIDRNIIFCPVDVQRRNELKTVFELFVKQLGYVDIVVGGAAVFNENKPEDMVSVNLMGIINTTYEAMEWMSISKKGRGGIIANIASNTAVLYFEALPVYSATKHAVLGFTTSMANETNKRLHGIEFTTICPGMTDTPMSRNNIREKLTPDFAEMGYKLFSSIPGQSPAKLATHIGRILTMRKNGSIWIVESNKCIEYIPTTYSI